MVDTVWAMSYNRPIVSTSILRSEGKMMKVDVKSFAHLRLALGKSPVTMEIPEDTTVAGLINILIGQYGATAREAIWRQDGQTLKITPVYEGKVIALDATLQDGMTVVFMSIVAAG